MLGHKLQNAIKSAGMSTAEAAAYIGVSEANLYKLYKKSSFEVAYLIKASELLSLPVSYFLDDESPIVNSQIDNLTQAGSTVTQKAKSAKSPPQSQTIDLNQCQRELEALKRELEVTRALVAAKDETITLLRASYTRPS